MNSEYLVMNTVLAVTIVTFLAQLFGLFSRECTVVGTLVQLLMSALWAAGMFVLLFFFGFVNYCEHNCPSVLDNPLSWMFIAAAVVAGVIVTWWILFTIPQAWAPPRRVTPR